MAVTISRGATDEVLTQVAAALELYAADHPQARVDLYRQSRYSIRVRVIDPTFAKVSWVDRNDQLWDAFEGLPEDVQADISMLVLVTPGEMPRSKANLEFDDPVEQVLL